MQNDLYKRIVKTEAMAAKQNAELLGTLKDAYAKACESRDEVSAAELARKIRNKLLDESDNRMTFDRLGLTVPSGSTFTAWLTFLRGLGDTLKGKWAVYRQALRDLPEQPGFPFDIVFPDIPDKTESE